MKLYNDLTTTEKLACVSLYTEEAKKDEDSDIRREAYRTLGYTEEAKKDTYWFIRQGAYRTLGYTEEAKQDTYWAIRQGAYRALGYTEEAKQDEDSYIRQEAELYFKVKYQEAMSGKEVVVVIDGKTYKAVIQ